MAKPTITHTHSPDDLLAGIYLYSGKKKFTSNKAKIHSVMKTLVSKHCRDAGHIADDFVFSEGDIFPFSKTLENAIMRLQLSSILIAENPSYYKYSINDDIRREIIEEIERHFEEPEIALIKKMSKEFASECAVGD
jgi:hypothetical protein